MRFFDEIDIDQFLRSQSYDLYHFVCVAPQSHCLLFFSNTAMKYLLTLLEFCIQRSFSANKSVWSYFWPFLAIFDNFPHTKRQHEIFWVTFWHVQWMMNLISWKLELKNLKCQMGNELSVMFKINEFYNTFYNWFLSMCSILFLVGGP